MARWSPRRARLVRRRADGTFRAWPGGRRLSDLPRGTREQSQHGIGVHIGQMFRREHGRAARVGDVHRTKTRSGRYHRQAMWYIKTRHGWRRSPTEFRRPTPAEIRRVCAKSRPGRQHRYTGKNA